MSDADLIYNALLRAEKRIEARRENWPKGSDTRALYTANLFAVAAIREEIGNGLSEERR